MKLYFLAVFALPPSPLPFLCGGCVRVRMQEGMPMPMPVPLEARAEYQMSSSVTADISALRQQSLTELEAYQVARNAGQ